MSIPKKQMTSKEAEEWWNNIYKKLEEDREKKEQTLGDQRPLLLEPLRALVLMGELENPITVKYEGYGDSGGIEERPENLPRDVEDFLWEVLWNREAGFENNEGGYGHIHWDVTADVITINHVEYITETTERDYEL